MTHIHNEHRIQMRCGQHTEPCAGQTNVCRERAKGPCVQCRSLRCAPCVGTGKRHSIFDDCNCEPECVDLGVCGACGGFGTSSLPPLVFR